MADEEKQSNEPKSEESPSKEVKPKESVKAEFSAQPAKPPLKMEQFETKPESNQTTPGETKPEAKSGGNSGTSGSTANTKNE
jgi:hypothetical protein